MEDKPQSFPEQAPSCSHSLPLRRRTYTIEFKLAVLEWLRAHKSSVRATARRFAIHRRMIQRWLDNEDKLTSVAYTKGIHVKKLSNGRPPLSSELDLLLLSWTREEGSSLNDRMLKEKALEIANELHLNDFKASTVWLKGWKKRMLSDDTTSTTSVPPLLCGDSFLTHTSPNDTITLHFNEEKGHIPTTGYTKGHHVYNDYTTAEHNYCSTWLNQVDIFNTLSDQLLSYEHEETIGQSSSDIEGLKIIIKSTGPTSTRQSLHSYNEGVLAVGNRLSEPVFTISPEIFLN